MLQNKPEEILEIYKTKIKNNKIGSIKYIDDFSKMK